MKKLAVVLLSILILYAVYHDLTKGTIPESETVRVEAKTSDNRAIPYFEQKVKAGDTVLSILEKHTDEDLPVSVKKAVADFQLLNHGLMPEEIQYGKSYKFPDYRSNN
ncbi:hypothetical protein [Bacillus sp. T33-2]|uniref:hypothetical protein n=1 Tax=Bacillus sp. T33-2 TaxID=2054168 RepID=UPI000C78832F|nr:hypothetical protein [Bacillus sp. T33-2]PLR93850.1 hypothetical protein CVD19_19210 [Bacillus sp. T33-2]